MRDKQLQRSNTGLATQKVQHVLLNPPAFKDDYNTVYNVALTEVAKSYSDLDFKPPVKKDVDMMVSKLTNNIQDKYKQLRTEEIPTAFANGIRREYGEFLGLSVVTFEMFIKGYLNSRYRADLAKSIPVIEAPKEPSPEYKFDLATSNAIRAFLSYSNSKDITLVAPSVYRFLRKLKLVTYEEQEQAEFISQAQIDVHEELTRQKATVLDKNKRLEIEKQLGAVHTLEEKIILQAQRLGLYAYFQELIIEEVKLEELLKAKRKEIF